MKPTSIRIVAVIAVLALAGPVFAQETGSVIFRGWGGFAVGNSDEYPYLAGTGDGDVEWENAEFALNVTAHPHEKVRIQGQLGAEYTNEGLEPELEVAFAEWQFSDLVHFRGGISRQPFGIYADIYDIGTLRPFYYLPQSVYGEIGAVAENYLGFGAWGQWGDEWHMVYDVYFGGIKFPEIDPWRAIAEESVFKLLEDSDEEGGERFEDLENTLGVRLVFDTPVDGLSFGFSAYAGQPEDEDDEEGEEEEEEEAPKWGDQKAFGLQIEYMTGGLLVRSEFVAARKDENVDSFYLELAYTFGDHWQIAGSYDRADVDLDWELQEGESLLKHHGWSLGVNYWFTKQMVIKLSYTGISGNLLALPSDDLDEVIDAGNLEESNRLITLGMQFSF